MPVHLVFERPFADLVESGKFERDPTAVREKQAVKTYYQPLLIYAVHSRSRADRSCSSRHKNPLSIGGVKRNRY